MLTTILIIFNIILLEVILSIDNAAVLATIVRQLPEKEQKKALTYGILGAYFFRGLTLFFVSFLTSIAWLKVIGGIYLIFISIKSILKLQEEEKEVKSKSYFFLSPFWSTVLSIELMDLVFSIDNVFAAVAFTSNIWLIIAGVFVGILAIRFAAVKFIKLINQIPILEKVAYFVIMALGLKLVFSYWFKEMQSETFDFIMSMLTLVAFTVPVILHKYKK